jgi:hypothetical protein
MLNLQRYLDGPHFCIGRFWVVIWTGRSSHSHVVVCVIVLKLRVFHRATKDSRLSQLVHALLFMTFVAIDICRTSGLDLILDGTTHMPGRANPRHFPLSTATFWHSDQLKCGTNCCISVDFVLVLHFAIRKESVAIKTTPIKTN